MVTRNPAPTAGLLAALCLLGASCSGTLESYTPPDDRPTSSAAESATSSTTAAETTSSTSQDTTTTGADPEDTTTTLAPIPASPENPAYAFGGGWLLGAWDGTGWSKVLGSEATPPTFSPLPTFIPLGGSVETPDSVVAVGTCDWLAEDENHIPYIVEIDGELSQTGGPAGSTGSWPLQPRPVERVEDMSPYRDQVKDFLATMNISDEEANILNVWRVDIEGDGTNEVVIEARKTEGENLINQAPGNYSVVLIVTDLTDHLPVGLHVDGIPSDSNPAATDEDLGDYGYTIWAAMPAGIMDLNGDGQMEVILTDWGWESGGSTVFERVNGGYQGVLSEGCGA